MDPHLHCRFRLRWHYGVMMRGAPALSSTVVADSGTDELVGLSGKITINVVDGKHLCNLEYTLVASH
jgi:hypothetical protein